jgi:(p)ppGpp synthase/HD superfamily hydrolase
MEKNLFDKYVLEHSGVIDSIKEAASELHDITCNQKYGDNLPYSYHLCMVANAATEYGYVVCNDEHHILPIIFGAYFHDSIEDARVTYNDVLKLAKTFMDDEQAIIATEIVYALTDEKGRNRQERGSDKHYEDIRNTLYAPFVKWCDRYANTKYSIKVGSRMVKVYGKEMNGFIHKLGGDKYLSKELCELILSLK